jgi:hypothetical protein
MDLIARLRPRWRHPDPAVRAAAVRDMGSEERDRLGAIAGTDPDPHVRRIAIKKLEDPALLERVAQGEADPALRDLAVERAAEVRGKIATSGSSLAECTAALEGLTDSRTLATVAAKATHESVRVGALARVSGDRLLRDIVTGADDPAIRDAALDRIADPATLRSIALGDCPLELALRALERIDDPVSLQAIAGSRSAAKGVKQRAQALLVSRPGERPVVDVKEARARQLELLTLAYTLRAMPDVIQAAERVRQLQREWQELTCGAEPRAEVAEPFDKTCEGILRDAGSLARRRAEADAVRSTLDEGVVARQALCERVETLDGADAARNLATARAAWDRLPPVAGEQGVALARRFSLACEACGARHQRGLAANAQRADLETLAADAEALAGSSPLPSAQAWKALASRWNARPTGDKTSPEIESIERRFAAAQERFRERWQEAEQQRSKVEQANLHRLQALCGRLEEIAQSPALKPSAGRREVQAADAALGELGPLPPSERRATWTERLREARDRLLGRISQVEQTEEWRRWANASAQEEIIARVEALLESNDLAEGMRQLGRLQDDWAQVATTSADRSQALWERFRTSRNELRRRCDAYLASNLQKKRALCAQVAGLGDSTEWNETAAEIRRLQAEWKEIGPVTGRYTAALWQEFREPCDRFFARRKEHFDRLDEGRRESAKRKESLCEQVEALADSTDWEETATAIKQLQAEWKRSGTPPRGQADALWERFRTSCDRFFDRRNRREELAQEETIRSAHTICGELEALAASLGGEDSPPADQIGQKVDEAWGAWLRLGVATLDDARALRDRLHGACEQIAALRPESLRGTKLDPEATRKRRERLCARLETLLGTGVEVARETSLQEMALALRERLAANTIGGGADHEARSRQQIEREVERASTSWVHLGPALDDAARTLADRFERARARLLSPSK